jgi:uncharacterized membrane protein
MIYVLCLLLGIVAGLRVMSAAAALSVGAFLAWIDLSATPFAFVGHPITAGILVVLALVEMVTDQLPTTPARTVPQQFGARVVIGTLAGAILALVSGSWIIGAIAGLIGAVAGTLGGYQARKNLVAATGGRDLPIALLEDVVAIGLGLIVVWMA